MNKEEKKEQFKMNMESHDFYSNKCLEVEGELMEMFDELDSDKEELNEQLGKNIIDKGNSYLNLSTKFMQELERMEEFAPTFKELMSSEKMERPNYEIWWSDGGTDNATFEEVFKFYMDNIKATRESQMTVHNTLQIKLNLIQKLIDDNGYGSYD